jgi:hypothetical protein
MPPIAIRIFRFFGKAALTVLALAPYVVGKVLGPVTLIIYGGAAILYLIGKVSLPASKRNLLLVSSVMGAQAFWILAGAVYFLIGDGQDGKYPDSSQTNWVVASVLMGVAYLATIGWFIAKTTLQSALTLFTYVGVLLFVYSSNSYLGTVEDAAAKGIVLQILTFSTVLLLIPLTYYDYSKSYLPEPARADRNAQVHQSLVAKSPLIKVAVTAVCLVATAAILWAVYSRHSFKDQPATPSLTAYDTQSAAGRLGVNFDLAGARKVGYSDADIAEYLAGEASFDIAGARRAGYPDEAIINFIISRPSYDPPKASWTWEEARSGRPTSPMFKFIPSPLPAQSVDEHKKGEIEALTKVYPNWRDIVGAVASKDLADPKNEFRVWLGKQPKAYQTLISDTNTASVLIAAIDKFQADKVKAAVSPPPAAP